MRHQSSLSQHTPWKGHVRSVRRWPFRGRKEKNRHQKPNLSAPWSWTSSLQNCGKINFCCVSPQSVVFCGGSGNRLRQGEVLEKAGSPQRASFLFGVLAFLVLVSWQLRAHSSDFPARWLCQSSGQGCSLFMALVWLCSLSFLCHFWPGKAFRKKVLQGWSVKVYSTITGNGNLIGSS